MKIAPAFFRFAFFGLFVLTLMFAAAQPSSAQCQNGIGTSPIPQYMRVDIADGTTGLLLVSWNHPTGGTYTYNLCRSTSSGSGYQLVNYCSVGGGNPQYNTNTPSGPGIICRDDNGVLAGVSSSALTPGTIYYYEVQACNSSGTNCGAFNSVNNPQTDSFYSNAPISCNCAVPTMQGALDPQSHIVGIKTPSPNTVATSTLIPPALDQYPYPCAIGSSCATVNQYYAFHNPGPAGDTIPFQNKLVISLPGSDGLCSRSDFMWVAQNLGFDTLCVNYDDNTEQETICAQSSTLNTQTLVANCFTNISQAKLNWTTGPTANCTLPNQPLCGADSHNTAGGKTGADYYVYSKYDAVVPRITMMLYWLWCNENAPPTYWQTYLLNNGSAISTGTPCPSNQQTASVLTNYSPNWSSILMGGFSQGGDMGTFAAYYYATASTPAFLNRVFNLSAPPSAAAVGNTVVPASYLSSMPSTIIRSIYGLVSANDPHYCVGNNGNQNASVYQAVWSAMGFTSANNDTEYDLNFNASNPAPCPNSSPNTPPHPHAALACSTSESHNVVNWAPVNEPGKTGHTDTLAIWNEDIYEYMLIN
jgi:hypothetical protein